MGPILKNEPFNMFVFFKEGIDTVDTSVQLTCFDSKKKAELHYKVEI